MALHDKIIRHYLIINKVRNPGFPSFDDIEEMLEDHGYSLSKRTLQRDIENIRKEFGIEIRYTSYHNGYDIDKERSIEMDSLVKFMEMAVMSSTFNEFYSKPEKVKPFVSFDSEDAVKGVQYFERILFALKNSRVIKLNYQRFIDQKAYTVRVKPGLLKEYQNRWYLVGKVVDSGSARAYAMDRTQDLAVDEEVFDVSECEEIRERFDFVIGISGADKKPELVKLAFKNEQASYIETLPWHPTQEVVSKNEKETVFSLYVVHNYELVQKILAEGNHVLWAEPESLSQLLDKRK